MFMNIHPEVSEMSSGNRLFEQQSREETLLTRRQVEDLIAQGRSIIIVDRSVLKIDAWLPYHPGGDQVIKHMIGRDATEEVNALVLEKERLHSTCEEC